MLGRKSFLTACVAAAVVAVACTSTPLYLPPTASFPYDGPSCSGNDFNGNCWLCVVEECPTQAACIQPDAGQCDKYFDCFCQCAAGDAACHTACEKDQSGSCTTCEDKLAACEAQACGAFCGNGVPPSPDAAVGVGDASGDGATDATVDGGTDAAGDAAPDATMDGAADASDGAVTDVGTEAAPEAAVEASAESGATEAGTDAATDAGTDGAPDAGADVQAEAAGD